MDGRRLIVAFATVFLTLWGEKSGAYMSKPNLLVSGSTVWSLGYRNVGFLLSKFDGQEGETSEIDLPLASFYQFNSRYLMRTSPFDSYLDVMDLARGTHTNVHLPRFDIADFDISRDGKRIAILAVPPAIPTLNGDRTPHSTAIHIFSLEDRSIFQSMGCRR